MKEEYVVVVAVINQAIWPRKLLIDLNLAQNETTKMKCDNKSIVAIAKNIVFHGRTNHFKIKFHFIGDIQKDKENFHFHYRSK